jgi:hypothetical protein
VATLERRLLSNCGQLRSALLVCLAVLSSLSASDFQEAVVVGNLPNLKGLISKATGSSYEMSGGYERNNRATQPSAVNRQKISGPSSHIRLYDIETAGNHTNDIKASYGSQEYLRTMDPKGMGITRTHEVSITREPNHSVSGQSRLDTTDQDSVESIRKYQGSPA